jgi:membrane protease YdiL (CAAX protease family)
MPVKKLSSINAVAVFLGFTVYFFILLFTLLPYLKNNYSTNSALYWFITGYFLFIPYVYSKTDNTLTGIFIHGIYNGPIFILAALGIVK